MDFFDHQDRARKNTGRLVGLFFLAVLGIVFGAYVIVAVALGFVQSKTGDGSIDTQQLLDVRLLGAVGGGVLAVVALGSGYKLLQLA
ncbi:MAG: M48 family metallopeptidase, partial [Planctomycetota bacterium]